MALLAGIFVCQDVYRRWYNFTIKQNQILK